jgi:hypothetical protein
MRFKARQQSIFNFDLRVVGIRPNSRNPLKAGLEQLPRGPHNPLITNKINELPERLKNGMRIALETRGQERSSQRYWRGN